MKYNSLIPELVVSNINETKNFYINKLGFTLEYERDEDNFVFLSYNNSQFMFEQMHKDSWNTGDLERPFGRGINFSICATDIDELYKEILHHDIKPYRKLEISTYRVDSEEVKEIHFLIQDPDGYLLRFTT